MAPILHFDDRRTRVVTPHPRGQPASAPALSVLTCTALRGGVVRVIGRRVIALSAVALLAACSHRGPAVPSPAPPLAGAGIVVVAAEEPSSPVIGFIDPSSGRYTQGATLNIAPQTFDPADRGT